MKKILLVVLVLLLVVVGGAVAFIATFDLNRYRSTIVEKASEALGAPVNIGKISLTWRNGLALRVQELTVYSDAEKKTASAHLKEASAALKLAPLLNKEIQISSIILMEPQAILVKNPDGRIGLKGANPQAPVAQAPSSKTGSNVPMPVLSINLFQVRGAAVRYQDATANPPMDITVKNADVDVKNFSLTKPFSFRARAALFSSKQNMDVEGVITLPEDGKGGLIEKAVFKTDLGSLNLAELGRAVPAVDSARLEDLRGALEAKASRVDLSGKGPMNATVSLQDGRVKLASSKGALENLELKAALAGDDLKIDNFSADYAGGKIKTNGIVKDFRRQALSGITWSSHDLAIAEMMPESGTRGPKLSGRLSLDLEGQASGTAWPQISQTLNGKGELSLKEGVLLDYNLLRTVVEKISMVPGAEGVLRDNLPNIYKAKMNEPSTLLQPIQMPFAVQNGQIYFNRLELVTDFIIIQGAGQVGLDKSVAMRTTVRLHQQLSGAIVALVPQAQILTNAQGEIEMPGQLQGVLPHVTFAPDTDFLAQKLLSSEAVQKTIQGFVQNPEQGVNQIRNLLDKPAKAGESGVQNSVAGLLQALGTEKKQQ